MKTAMRWLAAVLVLLAPAGRASADETPHAAVRLERVATALDRSPLFVDDEFAGVLGDRERAQIRKAIGRTSRSLGAPVFVVVAPNTQNSEAQGYNDIFLHWLHERLGKDGLYVMVDQSGDMEGVPFGVPRRFTYKVFPSELRRPAQWKEPFDGLGPRIEQALASAAAAPSGAPETPRLYSSADPFGGGKEERSSPREPDIFGSFFWGLLGVGPMTTMALLAVIGAAIAFYRVWKDSLAPTWPSVKRLRALADKELSRLAARMPPPDDAPGRLVALRSYDAARILSDDVGRRPSAKDVAAALDLVGVVVLARQGREVLAKGLARPLAPCVVNPLHGPGVLSRKTPGESEGKACEKCADLKEHERAERVLRMPGGRRYTQVKGPWQRRFADRDLAARVLESLGVE